MRSVGVVLAVLALVACSGSDGDTADNATVPPVTATELKPEPPATTLAVTVRETPPSTELAVDESVFSFARDDMCEWVTTEEVAEMVSAVYPWDGEAEIDDRVYDDPVWRSGCRWVLSGTEGNGFLRTGDVSNFYAEHAQEGALDHLVSEHPALSDGVVMHQGSFTVPDAFSVPPLEEYLEFSMGVPGVGDLFDEDRYFHVVDAVLRELGWIPEGTLPPETVPSAAEEAVEGQPGCLSRSRPGTGPVTMCADPPIVPAEVG